MNLFNQCFDIRCVSSFSFVDWRRCVKLLLSVCEFFLLLKVLMRNDTFLYFLVLVSHFLNVLSHLVNSPFESFIHLARAWTMNRLCMFIGRTSVNLIFDLIPLLSQLVQFCIQMISGLKKLLNLNDFWTNIVRLVLQTFYLLIELLLHAFTFDIFGSTTARICQSSNQAFEHGFGAHETVNILTSYWDVRLHKLNSIAHASVD